MDNLRKTEELEQRVKDLETVAALHMKGLEELTRVIQGHQRIIEAMNGTMAAGTAKSLSVN